MRGKVTTRENRKTILQNLTAPQSLHNYATELAEFAQPAHQKIPAKIVTRGH